MTQLGGGLWSAQLTDGTVLGTKIRRPMVEIAKILLDNGADPRSQIVLRHGGQVIAFDVIHRATGCVVGCDDEAEMQRRDL
jgi:hypothetical protein